MFGVLNKWRRKRLLRQSFPSAWLKILRQGVPYYGLLTPKEQEQLRHDIKFFCRRSSLKVAAVSKLQTKSE